MPAHEQRWACPVQDTASQRWDNHARHTPSTPTAQRAMSQQASFGENQSHADSTQPEPVRSEHSVSVTDAVIKDMVDRRELGIKKYGVELLSNNGRDALLDAYQESLDTTLYLKQCLIERDRAKQTNLFEFLDEAESKKQTAEQMGQR